MAEKRKNNPIYLVLLIGALLLVVYVVFIKEDQKPTRREVVSYERLGGELPDLSGGEAPDFEKKDSTTAPKKPMQSLDDLDEGLRNTIKAIDRNLDQAYSMDVGKSRNDLLDRTKFLIDSLMKIYDNPFLYVSMGDLYMLVPDFVKAEANYEKGLNRIGDINGLARNRATASYNAAGEMLSASDTDAAISYMETYCNQFPKDSNASGLLLFWYKKRAVGKIVEKDNQGGLELLQKALEFEPNDYSNNFNLGIALYRLGNLEAAISHFTKCLEIRNEDRYANDYLYIIYSAMGDEEKAQQYYVAPENVTIPIEQKK